MSISVEKDGDVVWYKRQPEHQLYSVGSLFVSRWNQGVSLEMLVDQNAAEQLHKESYSPRFPFLALIEHAGMPPLDQLNDEFRDTAKRFAQENQHIVAAISYVIPMDGFVGSIARSVVAGINMVMSQAFPTKVHKDLDEGLAWLWHIAEEQGQSFDRTRAVEVLAQVRTDWS
jgi:hypothetical protein